MTLRRTLSRIVVGGFPRLALGVTLAVALGCAHRPDAKTVHEAVTHEGLTYTLEIDATRLEHGTGLRSVAAVSRLLEDNLTRFFRVTAEGAQSEQRRELIAESPAPGYGVRAIVEARPDDYCVVSMQAVRLREGAPPEAVERAPYSLHYGLTAVRAALSSLRTLSRAPLTAARFAALRRQASELATRGEDPPLDEAAFAHAPRPLDRSDEEPRYYAPSDAPSTLRGE